MMARNTVRLLCSVASEWAALLAYVDAVQVAEGASWLSRVDKPNQRAITVVYESDEMLVPVYP